MQKACQTLIGSVAGNTDLDNYILSSRVAPDTTDANVHALCTKPAVLKMEESGKSSRGFRKKPSNCQRNNRISNLQTSSKWEVCLTSTAFNESTDSPTFSNFTIKKNRNPFVVKVNQLTTKFKSVFDSHYQMHIRLTHNRSRRFHVSVETNLLFVHISVRTYKLIFDICIQST